MSPVVVAHHSIAGSGQHPSGWGPVRCLSFKLLAVYHCQVLVPFVAIGSAVGVSVVLLVITCWVICHGYGAGVVCLFPGLLSFTVPVCHCHPIPYPCVCHSPSLSPVICFLSVVALLSILRAGAHKVGCSLRYNIFKT
jgi:hypothetical protein